MGNTHVKPHPRSRNKKQVHWKAAARPPPPSKPQLASESESLPDVVTIRWSKPINDGGSPVSGYLVEHRRQGSPHWVRATPLLVQNCELTVSGLEPGWRYQFRVSAENAVGISDCSEISEPITVTLHKSAVTAPRFTQELKELSALENEKAEFVVHFLGQPAPKVCWFKDTFEIFSSRRIRILTETDRSVLTIHQCSLSDEGEIKCTATNRAGHVSTKSKLTVEAPPTIRLPRQYADGLLFEIGEKIRLKVSVAGRPTPLVFWSHNGESIKNSDRYETEYVDKCSILKISEARRDDRGEYQIKAVNKLGQDIQSFLVTVTDKPSPPGRARVVMALGRSVTLSWGIPHDDGGCKIGNYIVEYYRIGWNVWLKAATSRQLTTILGDLIEGSEYKFRIKAESPYGVSDPSEETEIIFIPDPKRGITQPPSRGRSQPKEISNTSPTTPVAARRKNKPRSQSSSRADSYSAPETEPPVRPERTKIKSPPITPQRSPALTRKQVDARINRELFERSDRSSVARDLAYGSPDIKLKKDLSNQINPSSSEQSRTPSPSMLEKSNKTFNLEPLPASDAKKTDDAAKKSPSPEIRKAKTPTPSPEYRRKSPRDTNESFTGSSEFMLVLYPDDNDKDHSDFYFDENVAPPMSLSAPELGTEELNFENLRNSCSSTELLHERAMIRIYQAAEAEERELAKRRQSTSIPKIRINSKDEENVVGLERNASFRRRLSAGGITHQQAIWAQKRHSLKTPSELKEELVREKSSNKYGLDATEKRQLMMTRERSESEEKEEQAFEDIRKRTALQNQTSLEKNNIPVAGEDNWADDYVSSTEDESETESSSAEILNNVADERRKSYDSEEEQTYHPRRQLVALTSKEEPFEILTKRKEPPSPDFVPKPILKKPDRLDIASFNTMSPDSSPNGTLERASSPIPKNIFKRSRSHSLADTAQSIKSFITDKPKISRKRSSSIAQVVTNESVTTPIKPVSPDLSRPAFLMSTISTVAQITGITAASIVIPEKLLEKQRDAEEAKVAIDHYGDILKNYGSRRKSNTPIYTDRDTLKKLAEGVETDHSLSNDAEQPDREIGFTESRTINDQYVSARIQKQEPIDTGKTEVGGNTVSDILQNKMSVSNERLRNDAAGALYSRRPQIIENTEATSSYMQKSLSPVRTLKKNIAEARISPTQTSQKMRKSVSPLRSKESLKESDNEKRSPSPRKSNSYVYARERQTSGYRPMLKEIMTQTSESLASFDSDSYSRTSSPSSANEELIARAEIKVRSTIDYITDLSMFLVACWLYIFSNELFAIPLLFLMAYRQLQEEISKKIPEWIKRRLRRKNKG